MNDLFHGEESKLGAVAGESIWAQNPKAFWEFHKQLFANQPVENHDAPWITVDKIVEVASQVQPAIDMKKLQADLKGSSMLQQIDLDQQLVQQYQVQQTPNIMINDKMLTNPFDYDTLVKVIEDLL